MASSTQPSSNPPAAATDEGPSLLEQMMAEGMKAQAVKEVKKKVEEERMKTGFGSGLKGGFFASSSPATESTSQKSHEALRPSKTGGGQGAKKDDIPLITKHQDGKGMVLPEVQAAMQESTPPALRALQSGEWITPDLLEKMSSNPRLMAGLQHPRCAAALQEMQANPKVALAKYKDDPLVAPFLMDFCQLMGVHFTQMGAQEKAKDSSSSSTASSQSAAPKGPLVEKALKKHQESHGIRARSSADEERRQEEKVKQILADPELRSLLMDPDMQRVLQECGQPGKLQLYMRDPVMSAKLRKLADAGLVQIQR